MPDAVGPARAVERVFGAIAATRMAGLPLNNPALAVEARGFRPWNGLWLGVLVTPWTMNLMLLPDGHPDFRRLGADQRQAWTFPSGDYEFHGAEEAGLGPYQCCPLLSPVFEFAGQEDAQAAADAALAALFAPPQAEAPRPMSRRAFLRGLRPDGEKSVPA